MAARVITGIAHLVRFRCALILALLPGCTRAVSVSSSPPPARSVAARTGEEVLGAMHDRYADSWYRTLRFRQRVIYSPRADGTTPAEQVMLEHLLVPGALRIDMAANYNGNATLFAGDSTYVLRDGEVTQRRKGGNVLLVLGFDVYRQPVEATAARLRAEGFDLAVLDTTTWQGRPAYIIGATAGDSTRAQFWVDRERLLFVRLLLTAPQARTEVRFDDYRELAGGWISALVIFIRDGREMMREVYYDIEGNPALPDGLLDPARWDRVRPKQ